MRGKPMWLDEFKIAVANDDAEAIAALAGEVPSKFDSLEDALQAKELLGAALNLIQKNRAELGKELEKLKNVKKYIAS